MKQCINLYRSQFDDISMIPLPSSISNYRAGLQIFTLLLLLIFTYADRDMLNQ